MYKICVYITYMYIYTHTYYNPNFILKIYTMHTVTLSCESTHIYPTMSGDFLQVVGPQIIFAFFLSFQFNISIIFNNEMCYLHYQKCVSV